MPAIPEVSIPLLVPMVAVAGVPELQVPPVMLLLNVVVVPTHNVVFPAIAEGSGFTVIGIVVKQPNGVVYIILATPAATPVIFPVLISAVAMDVLALLHVPLGVASVNDVMLPWQTEVIPEMAVSGFTVTVAVTAQPATVAYVITDVPEFPVVIVPLLAPMAAIAGLPEPQVPPLTELLNVVVLPWHTVVFPAIAVGITFTVKAVLITQPAAVV